jgi:DNA primase
MVHTGQIDTLNTMFHATKPFIEFVLEEMLRVYDLRNPKAKEQAMHECVGYLKTLSPLLQEEYKRFLAAKLSISASLIRLTQQQSMPGRIPQMTAAHDVWELGLIKSLMENPALGDQILDAISADMLQFHAYEFSLVLQQKFDDPRLMAIALDESIKSYSDEQTLHKELITFLTQYYSRELKKVLTQHLDSFEKKSFLIREIRGKIAMLKKGQLVTPSR